MKSYFWLIERFVLERLDWVRGGGVTVWTLQLHSSTERFISRTCLEISFEDPPCAERLTRTFSTPRDTWISRRYLRNLFFLALIPWYFGLKSSRLNISYEHIEMHVSWFTQAIHLIECFTWTFATNVWFEKLTLPTHINIQLEEFIGMLRLRWVPADFPTGHFAWIKLVRPSDFVTLFLFWIFPDNTYGVCLIDVTKEQWIANIFIQL